MHDTCLLLPPAIARRFPSPRAVKLNGIGIHILADHPLTATVGEPSHTSHMCQRIIILGGSIPRGCLVANTR